MKINLKDNIWIEGFVTQTGVDLELLSSDKSFLRDDLLDEFNSNLLYEGKTSEIPEALAKECVKHKGDRPWFKNYDSTHNHGNLPDGWYELHTSKESIQSACPEPYCLIYKTE